MRVSLTSLFAMGVALCATFPALAADPMTILPSA